MRLSSPNGFHLALIFLASLLPSEVILLHQGTAKQPQGEKKVIQHLVKKWAPLSSEKEIITRTPSTLCTAIFQLLNWNKSLAKMKDPKFKRCKNGWLVFYCIADVTNRQPSETHSRDFFALLFLSKKKVAPITLYASSVYTLAELP
jgi:hypothetical protein